MFTQPRQSVLIRHLFMWSAVYYKAVGILTDKHVDLLEVVVRVVAYVYAYNPDRPRARFIQLAAALGWPQKIALSCLKIYAHV